VPNTGRTPKRRARVAADPVQRFMMRRRVTHDFRAEQQFSRKDFFERQRHHTSKKTHTLSHTADGTNDQNESQFEHVRRHLRIKETRTELYNPSAGMKFNNNRLYYVILIIIFVNRRRTTTRRAQDYCEIRKFCREIVVFLLSETLVLRREGYGKETRRSDTRTRAYDDGDGD